MVPGELCSAEPGARGNPEKTRQVAVLLHLHMNNNYQAFAYICIIQTFQKMQCHPGSKFHSQVSRRSIGVPATPGPFVCRFGLEKALKRTTGCRSRIR